MTEIVPTFSSWKREQKKLRAVSDTQPKRIFVFFKIKYVLIILYFYPIG